MKFLNLFLVALLAAPFALAQDRPPAASPAQTLTQVVGKTDVTLVYSRPSVRGREIFGGLVPYDEVWRTGANASTKLSLAGDATIGGVKVPAGEYALYTRPGKDTWAVIIYTNTSHWGSNGFDEANILGEFTAPVTLLKDSIESFTIGFTAFDGYTATMHIDWANVRVAFPIETMPPQ